MLKGKWRAEHFVVNGSAGLSTQTWLKEILWEYDGEGRVLVTRDGKKTEFRYYIDSTTNPKQMDIWYEGSDKDLQKRYAKRVKSIYKFDKGVLIRCGVEPGKPRPQEFESRAGSGVILLHLRRIEK